MFLCGERKCLLLGEVSWPWKFVWKFLQSRRNSSPWNLKILMTFFFPWLYFICIFIWIQKLKSKLLPGSGFLRIRKIYFSFTSSPCCWCFVAMRQTSPSPSIRTTRRNAVCYIRKSPRHEPDEHAQKLVRRAFCVVPIWLFRYLAAMINRLIWFKVEFNRFGLAERHNNTVI